MLPEAQRALWNDLANATIATIIPSGFAAAAADTPQLAAIAANASVSARFHPNTTATVPAVAAATSAMS